MVPPVSISTLVLYTVAACSVLFGGEVISYQNISFAEAGIATHVEARMNASRPGVHDGGTLSVQVSSALIWEIDSERKDGVEILSAETVKSLSTEFINISMICGETASGRHTWEVRIVDNPGGDMNYLGNPDFRVGVCNATRLLSRQVPHKCPSNTFAGVTGWGEVAPPTGDYKRDAIRSTCAKGCGFQVELDCEANELKVTLFGSFPNDLPQAAAEHLKVSHLTSHITDSITVTSIRTHPKVLKIRCINTTRK